MSGERPHGLTELARLYNVQTSYCGVDSKRREASPETLLRVIRALGAPVENPGQIQDALREKRQALWQAPMSPVLVAWDGQPGAFLLRCPSGWAGKDLDICLELESGEVRSWRRCLPRYATAGKASIEGVQYLVKRIALPGKVPWGYHRLRVRVAGQHLSALILSAPDRAYVPDGQNGQRMWGVFLPLYALHSERSWASGDFSDLQSLMGRVQGLGGRIVGTLPLLAAFLDKPFEISPYSPVSRLFWNEFYLDVTRIPDLERCAAARDLMASAPMHRRVQALRDSPTVDYRAQMQLKRKVLEELARAFFLGGSERRTAFDHFVTSRDGIEDYARFRAVCERQGAAWPAWPQRLRDGEVRPGDYDEAVKRYHLFVQWLADEQLGAVARKTNAPGAGLYLDLPLGVHCGGYDVWQERELFPRAVSAGAPPDSFFTGGQDWGFAPLRPDKIREQDYAYLVAVVRHHLKYASALRIDHVMGLHRLYWIPEGLGAAEGVYVRYPYEELYAILSLESHRHQALIAGENLGTVPAAVNAAMARHGIQRMYVAQYEAKPDPQRALPPVPHNSVASLNTHDMRPFAAFWEALDIKDMVRLGFVNEAGARLAGKKRQRLKQALVRFLVARGWMKRSSLGIGAVMKATVARLSAGPARIVLINLEDCWLERESQNLPSAGEGSANWQRKMRYKMEDFFRMPEVLDLLAEVARLRNASGKGTIEFRAGLSRSGRKK